MNQITFSPLEDQLCWQNTTETFWINLQLIFDQYQQAAKTDIDQLAAYTLAQLVFHEEAGYEPTWCLHPLGALALRRMYVYHRLHTSTFDSFLFQFEALVRQIEKYFLEKGRTAPFIPLPT